MSQFDIHENPFLLVWCITSLPVLCITTPLVECTEALFPHVSRCRQNILQLFFLQPLRSSASVVPAMGSNMAAAIGKQHGLNAAHESDSISNFLAAGSSLESLALTSATQGCEHVLPVPEVFTSFQVCEEEPISSLSISESSGSLEDRWTDDHIGFAARCLLKEAVARYVGYLVNAALVEVGEQRAKELQERADMLLLAERESHAIKLKVSSLIRSARDHGRPADLDGNWQIKSMTQGTSYFLHRLVIKGNQVTLADGARSKLKRVHGTLYIEGGAVELTGKELHRQGKSAESHQIYVRADVKHIQEANQENDIIDMESVVPKVSHNSSVSTPRCSSCWDLVAMLQDVDLEDQDVDDRKDHASHKESAFESCHNSVVLTEEYEHDTFATLQELDHQDQDEDDQDQELLPSVAAALHGKR